MAKFTKVQKEILELIEDRGTGLLAQDNKVYLSKGGYPQNKHPLKNGRRTLDSLVKKGAVVVGDHAGEYVRPDGKDWTWKYYAEKSEEDCLNYIGVDSVFVTSDGEVRMDTRGCGCCSSEAIAEEADKDNVVLTLRNLAAYHAHQAELYKAAAERGETEGLAGVIAALDGVDD